MVPRHLGPYGRGGKAGVAVRGVGAWAQEQHAGRSGHRFERQDVFVAWHQRDGATGAAGDVLQRYCHVYCEGELRAAVDEYAKAAQLSPTWDEAHFNLATAYGGLGRYEESLEFCEALAADPTISTPWRPLSNCESHVCFMSTSRSRS